MKNKNEAIAEQYVNLSSSIMDQLFELQKLMSTPEYKEAVKYDEKNNNGDNFMYDEFEFFVQGLNEAL